MTAEMASVRVRACSIHQRNVEEDHAGNKAPFS
jgi:hypothetical protein